MTQQVAKHEGAAMIPWTREEVEVIKQTVAKGANLSDPEFKVFAHVCKHLGADPLRKEIYAVRYEQNRPPVFQVAIDFYRKKAAESGRIESYIGPHWCGDDGEWTDVWLASEPPKAARFGVRLAGLDDPVYAVVLWSEYNKGQANWKSMPVHMIGKVAEAHCYRRALPDMLGGIVTNDEMQAGYVATETIDHESGEISEEPAPELFGANGLTIEQFAAQVRDGLQQRGLTIGEAKKLPGASGKNFKEVLANWGRGRPDDDVVAVALQQILELQPKDEPPAASEAAAAADVAEGELEKLEGEVINEAGQGQTSFVE